MAYRRRQHGITRASTFKEEIYHPPPDDNDDATPSNASPSPSLAAQAIRASAAHRDSSLSSAYGGSAFHSSFNDRSSKGLATDDVMSLRTTNESGGFWGVLARKAKAILDDDTISDQFETPNTRRPQMSNASAGGQFYHPYQSPESTRKMENPRLRKGLDALTSSINHIGDTIGNALEEGRSIMENKTADIIQETRRLQIRRKGINPEEEQHQVSGVHHQWQESTMQASQPQTHTSPETQIKASRDVAMATAAKAKLLLRELKTVKADLAFAKQRCSQLEEENKILREAREKGDYPADDDMVLTTDDDYLFSSSQIRLQLETLLAEKARLAHENSVYARENRFLREIVEYHQLTMQDVVYLDEGIEEVTEVYPIPALSRMLSASPPSPASPRSSPETSPTRIPAVTKEASFIDPHQETADVPQNEVLLSSSCPVSTAEASTSVPQNEVPSSSSSPASTAEASTSVPQNEVPLSSSSPVTHSPTSA
ncbi:hypothetical protein RJ639_046616 [Escallonia herrerae]|uniref:Uncharacterized protein n=1 Tax=Escallonia herrerae TaxID=1293975 RepID=A0AA89B100_9ASTE|nr:hypothetical protein RJ639_046616 [Escallonia herrerae]